MTSLTPSETPVTTRPDLEKYKGLFLEESSEFVEQIFGLLSGEASVVETSEATDELFRCFHSLKGMAGAMGYGVLSRKAHEAENHLHAARDGKSELHKSRLVAWADAIWDMLQEIKSGAAGGHREGPVREAERARGQGAAPCDAAAASDETKPAQPCLLPASLRLPVDRLDAIVSTACELTYASNRLLDRISRIRDPELSLQAEGFVRTLKRMRSSLVEVRMLPFSVITSRIEQAAEALAGKLAKPVSLSVTGDAIGLDRSIIEMLVDPLIHMVRNAVDHGIEPAAVRRAMGKPDKGRIALRLERAANAVLIRLSDDGKGIDPEAVKARAVALGLLSAHRAAGLSDGEAVRLVTRPGFSESHEVTEWSGRGVGLDVVRRRVESAGGRVDIASRPGAGTTVTLRIPFTMVTIDALIVRVADETFAVPLTKVSKVAGATLSDLALKQGRGRLFGATPPVPLFDLGWILGLRGFQEAELGEGCHVLMVANGERVCGLVVKAALEHREVLVKPMRQPLEGIAGYAGATVLADGSPALILDPEALVELALSSIPGEARSSS